MKASFNILRPRSRRVPLVISCPHSGTELPDEIAKELDPAHAAKLPDTDWFVHDLYDFSQELGITLVHARYSRYVIDLNRDPTGHKLYMRRATGDGHGPAPVFLGEKLYRGLEPDMKEIRRRFDLYYEPYHMMLAKLLSELRADYQHVLLFDAHSIKRHVATIQPEPFPDMILGDQNGKTAVPALSELAAQELSRPGKFKLSRNAPFAGGYITRRFGEPSTGVSALQLEMAQDIYMDEANAAKDASKQRVVQDMLRTTLAALVLNVRQMTQQE